MSLNLIGYLGETYHVCTCQCVELYQCRPGIQCSGSLITNLEPSAYSIHAQSRLNSASSVAYVRALIKDGIIHLIR